MLTLSIAAAYSRPSLPLITGEACHPFHAKAATDSTAKLPSWQAARGSGWGLIRTQTLADGCDYCDFRMKRDAATQITSKTPEVQKAIERIHRQKPNNQIVAKPT